MGARGGMQAMAAAAGGCDSGRPLSMLLRRATRAGHRAAERSALVRRWMGGRVDRASYLRYLQALQAVYGALEPAWARWPAARRPWRQSVPVDADGPCAAICTADDADWRGHFDMAALARLEAVRADVQVWAALGQPGESAPPAGSDASGPVEPNVPSLPAQDMLVARIARWVQAGDDARLLAHAYVRYLGDLSGGALLAARLAAAGAPAAGLNLYRFDLGAASTGQWLNAFRHALDVAGVRLGRQGRATVVDEARAAFDVHQRLFEQLLAFER